MNRLCFVSLLLIAFTLPTTAGEIYKYKNPDGSFTFTDKKASGKLLETRKASEPESPEHTVRAWRTTTEAGHGLAVYNSFYAPVSLTITSKAGLILYSGVIAPQQQAVVEERPEPYPSFRYYWIMGDTDSEPDGTLYGIPFSSPYKHRVSQGFNGSFTHNTPSSQHAIDIALPIGTNIVAAREGVVVYTQNDYVFSGQSSYFLDKANQVVILHQDGTLATYAHLLQGSLKVKPGDLVKQGELLGRSGTSGYSTGPHLHFVIRRNKDDQQVSVPFQFAGKDGAQFTPRYKNMLCSVCE
ncbi:peptidoglycan DD-metalloendopeptidase family protein [Parendozoicomonas haliclonae]|uniref:Murein DD-endopeptidase MepM n=1 Tax=Parendozoicomonas haliclonae TaxID=1960125 RepID=A0A1X7AEK1_9GAMM|nr:peptidoglycan DD-metalloendopeptidase family protein [Parendozoicomonas haliclonae]SMA34773.1 Murein DD-endopeptidase MepM [Parendozoicomonas haliclonae]